MFFRPRLLFSTKRHGGNALSFFSSLKRQNSYLKQNSAARPKNREADFFFFFNCQLISGPMLDLPQGSYFWIKPCTNGCKLTGVFFSEHCWFQPAGDLPEYKVSQKNPRSILKFSQESQPAMDLLCSECELSHCTGTGWKYWEIKWRFFWDETEDCASANCLPQGKSQLLFCFKS